ncbi:polycystin-1-like protein 2 [Aquarana catesbeiana]|uniref:polycystin-1-like protein 2 n=1 Tax=Aquarana catesbeiana TaxID=8400 RepID=UPI003CCA583D
MVPRDNDPCGLYLYLITLHTGHRQGAGTSAKVYLSIGGLHGQFGPILLSDNKSKVFNKGSKDIFLLFLPYPLGEIKSITLSHDGSGPHKRWYITQVKVQDVQLKKTWYFLCNAWLVEPAKGDTSSKTFTAANDQELRSFRNIFMKKTLRGLRDDNIWISVINHPARSVFTRIQKMSCCMCLFLCTMVINLMFWEMPQSNYPIIFSIGDINISWKDIMIAVESALLMFPVNLLIIYIFRNTQPKERKSGDKKGNKTANAKKGPSSQQSLATILENLSMVARTLSQNSWNNMEVDLNQEPSPEFTVLLQIISQLLQKQIPSGTLTVSIPLAQLSGEELHALFCGNYVSQKLRKVSTDLRQLENQQVLDKQQYEEFSTQLQALMNVLEKSIPPVPLQRSPQKKAIKKKRLPWWFLYIGWSLLISISIVSTYFTMMYGFLYGKQSSIRWIVSMFLSLFQSIFILQPLKVVGFAVFFALVLKKVDEEEDDLLDGELGLPEEYQTFDETAL